MDQQNKVSRTGSSQLAETSTFKAHSTRLIGTIASLYLIGNEGAEASNQDAKLQLSVRVSELMPKGTPDFPAVRSYPMLSTLIVEHGRGFMTKVVVMLIKDLAGSINLVRNMTGEQMIDAAAFLLDECDNFRLEDYVMMFTMAKRGQLKINDGKGIMDRLDIEIISKLLDAYWERRNAAGNRVQEAKPEHVVPAGAEMADSKAVGAALRDFIEQHKGDGLDDAEQEEIYRLEKIKQMQRDALRQRDYEQGEQGPT